MTAAELVEALMWVTIVLLAIPGLAAILRPPKEETFDPRVYLRRKPLNVIFGQPRHEDIGD